VRVLGSAVLAMEFLVMGFALLIAMEKHGSLALSLGISLAIAILLTAGMMKKMTGWYLGTLWQVGLIAYRTSDVFPGSPLFCALGERFCYWPKRRIRSCGLIGESPPHA
jgi:hypothetical protein